jgi:hypothetical protein
VLITHLAAILGIASEHKTVHGSASAEICYICKSWFVLIGLSSGAFRLCHGVSASPEPNRRIRSDGLRIYAKLTCGGTRRNNTAGWRANRSHAVWWRPASGLWIATDTMEPIPGQAFSMAHRIGL